MDQLRLHLFKNSSWFDMTFFKKFLGSMSVVRSLRFRSVFVCWLSLSHVGGPLRWGVHRLPRGFCGTCWGRLRSLLLDRQL